MLFGVRSERIRPPVTQPLSQADSQGPIAFMRLNTEFGNTGDLAINRQLVRMLAERGRLEIDVSVAPKRVVDEVLAGTDGLEVSASWAKHSIYLQACVAAMAGQKTWFFLTPGGFFCQKGDELVPGNLHRENYMLAACRAAGVRICAVGFSYEHLSPAFESYFRARAELCELHCPRDTVTADYLRRIGIRVHRIVPDLALAIPNMPPAASQGPGDGKIRVGLSFRSRGAADLARVFSFLKQSLHYRRTSVVLQPIVAVDRDLDGMLMLALLLREAGFEVESPANSVGSIDASMAAYRRCDVTMSDRLHGLLLAGLAGSRILACVPPSGAPKIRGVFSDLSLDGCVIEAIAGEEPNPATLDLASPLDASVPRGSIYGFFDELLGPATT